VRHPLRGAQRRSSQLPQRLPGREWDTRDGIMEVSIPKLRAGSCFPDWLLERRRRAERALTTVVATCYLLGVSTGRMEKLVETLGITRLFKSQVSVMAKELDEHSGEFRSCPLDAGPYACVAADALSLKVREGVGRRRTGPRCAAQGSIPDCDTSARIASEEVRPRVVNCGQGWDRWRV